MKSKSERAKEVFDIAFQRQLSLEEVAELTCFLHAVPPICVEVPELLLEGHWKNGLGFPVRKDPPHFAGDEYHVHVELPGSYEASWTVRGHRKHPGKFPTSIPKAVKAAAAKVLKVDPNLLETYSIDGGKTLLIELKEQITDEGGSG